MPKRSYWIDLFTGATWQQAESHGFKISGFRERRWKTLQRVKPGDYLLCYVTGISRFIGVLEVLSEAFKSKEKIWTDEDLACRVKVKPVVILTPETAIPILDLKDKLSIFRDLKSPRAWTGRVRGSPQKWTVEDGNVIVDALIEAKENPVHREVDPAKLKYWPRALASKRLGGVTVPDKESELFHDAAEPEESPTEHLRIQALLVQFGSDMGLNVWIARNDKNRIISGKRLCDIPRVIDKLPLQFDDATMSTVELIDVLWLKGKSIEAAFEIESTTSIYSGLLRLSDLISMQPNLNIPLYIVAPDERREKVKSEINRATFARLSPPMSEICGFIAFSILEKAMQDTKEHRQYMKPDYLEKLAESCETEDT